jgi:3-phosphoshikimate 1-carboxyvinyltransferase
VSNKRKIHVHPPLELASVVVTPPGLNVSSCAALVLAAMWPHPTLVSNCAASSDLEIIRSALARFGVATEDAGYHEEERNPDYDWHLRYQIVKPRRLPRLHVRPARELDMEDLARFTHHPLCPIDDPAKPIDVGASTIAARFLIALLAASRVRCVVTGAPQIGDLLLIEGLRAQGASIRGLGTNDGPPYEIQGARLSGGEIHLTSAASPDCVSALLLAAALAAAPTRIVLPPGSSVPPAFQRKHGLATGWWPEVDATLHTMIRNHAKAWWLEQDLLEVVPLQERTPESIAFARAFLPQRNVYEPELVVVEPDASLASDLLLLPLIYGGDVAIRGLPVSCRQAANKFLTIVTEMGWHPWGQDLKATVLCGGGKGLNGADVDLATMPETALSVAVLALHAKGPTRIRGVEVLRNHSIDRIALAARELRKLGAEVFEYQDGLEILPPARLREDVEIETLGDPRMAMAFSFAGRVTICDPGCVDQVFPGFFDVLAQLGMIERARRVRSPAHRRH